jgi:hypothetical protein
MSGNEEARRNPASMIFGFNTDISVKGTVYHVQTELREQEQRLESQVFVRGRCIGKRAAPVPSDSTEQGIQELARAQHRWIVEAVRAGFVDDVVAPQEPSEDLAVQFTGSERISDGEVVLRFRVLSGGYVAGSAEVDASWKTESASGETVSAFTDDAGVAEMHLQLAAGTVELEVKARLEGRETVRRFLVKSAKT